MLEKEFRETLSMIISKGVTIYAISKRCDCPVPNLTKIVAGGDCMLSTANRIHEACKLMLKEKGFGKLKKGRKTTAEE